MALRDNPPKALNFSKLSSNYQLTTAITTTTQRQCSHRRWAEVHTNLQIHSTTVTQGS